VQVSVPATSGVKVEYGKAAAADGYGRITLDELLVPGNDSDDIAPAAEAAATGCLGTLVTWQFGCFQYDIPPTVSDIQLFGCSKGGRTGSRCVDVVVAAGTSGAKAGIGRPCRLATNWTDATGQQCRGRAEKN